jgi:formate--tetrahydrofolate ligase
LPICTPNAIFFTDVTEAIHTCDHFTITVDDLIVNTGAGFIVAVCGEMMRMPGLPEKPAALQIDMIRGKIVGTELEPKITTAIE